MNELIFTSEGLDSLPKVSKGLIEFGVGLNVWLLKGDMGAGKTTLCKQLCIDLGVTDKVTSPTFALVNQYATSNGSTVYHFDFYRLKKESEAYELGVEDYFHSGYPCLVEWPENVQSFWPEHFLLIEITVTSPTTRSIKASRYE